MQQVHTGIFYLLEGLRQSGELVVLGFALDARPLAEFAIGMTEKQRSDFIAFRVSVAGGYINQPGVPAPTHSAPASPV